MPIKDWSEDDRPREKLMSQGAEACSAAELIAILITNGSRKKSAVELGADIMKKFNNNLVEFVRGSIDDYQDGIDGIGPAKACIIKAAAELGRRIGLANIGSDVIVNTTEAAYNLMRDLRQISHEEFWAIYTNNSGKLLRRYKVAEGTGGNVPVDIARIVRQAINVNATRVLLCHNHPGGSMRPSNEDIQLTRDIQTVCKCLNICVVEHIIIAGDQYYSFVENDLL